MMLYTRQLLVLFVSLYTVRIVLDVLGNEDYGLFSLIGGIVTLLSFLSNSMASATQRFFSFSIGKLNQSILYKIFSVNIVIYLIISFIAFLILESIGIWFIENKLAVNPERIDAVIFLFHCSVISFISTLLYAPFVSIIIAHEDMDIYAYISVIEVFLKLVVVFVLLYVDYDKLIVYGVLLLFVSMFIGLIYIITCLLKYEEVQLKKIYWDKKIFKKIIDFTSWTLFGQLSSVIKIHAVTILINQIFSPYTVAARAIASHITGKINMFSENFNLGLYPPIIKSYASNNKHEFFKLIFNGSKLTFFLMWILALPFILEIENIIRIWLIDPPAETIIFTRLAIIESLILSVTLPIATAARAPGKMKFYELTLGSLQIFVFIISWIVLKMGYPAYSIYIVAIAVNILIFFARLIIVKRLISLNIRSYINLVIRPLVIVVLLSTILTASLKYFLGDSIFESIIILFFGLLNSLLFMFYIGFDIELRKKCIAYVKSKYQNLS